MSGCLVDVPGVVVVDTATPASTAVTTGPVQITGTATKHRVVASIGGVGLHADHTTEAHQGAVVGISINTAASGPLWIMPNGGELIDSAWSWSDGPIYCSTDGQLTQTWPATGWSQQVAVASTATSLIVDIREAVYHA